MTQVRYEGIEELPPKRAISLKQFVETYARRALFPDHGVLVVKIFRYPRPVLGFMYAVHAELHHGEVISADSLRSTVRMAAREALTKLKRLADHKGAPPMNTGECY